MKIDFTFAELLEWAESKPDDNVIHNYPFCGNCTITTFLEEKLGIQDVFTAGRYAWINVDFGDDANFELPAWCVGVMQILDETSEPCGKKLRANEVAYILEELRVSNV
jgi:hypothetical protein